MLLNGNRLACSSPRWYFSAMSSILAIEPENYAPQWSLEAYFEREETAEIKHEYFNGEIRAMAGASEAHEIAAGNIFIDLGTHLRGKSCRAFKGDMKLKLSLQHADLVYYPDIMVTCDPADDDPFYKEKPTALIEVQSDFNRDHIEKLFAYQQIESLEEYAVIDPNPKSPRVWLYRKDNQWNKETIYPPDPFVLASLEFEMSLEAIYS